MKCTTQGCRKKARRIIAWKGRGRSRTILVAPYCENHAADIEVDLGGCPAAGPALSGNLAVLTSDLPKIEEQVRQQVREELRDARRDTDGVPFLDAARALCPDGAHWEDGGWERYMADASACLGAFLAAALKEDDRG